MCTTHFLAHQGATRPLVRVGDVLFGGLGKEWDRNGRENAGLVCSAVWIRKSDTESSKQHVNSTRLSIAYNSTSDYNQHLNYF